jgi:hypothetical protein
MYAVQLLTTSGQQLNDRGTVFKEDEHPQILFARTDQPATELKLLTLRSFEAIASGTLEPLGRHKNEVLLT